MLRGIFKFILSFFFASIFVVHIGQTEALSNTHSHSIVRHDVNIGCADNAVAPLNSIKDIQTFLNCNGFSPGPIDGVSGGRTTRAIKSFQASVGLTADGVVGPATKQAMRSYSSTTFTFTGSGWGHGVGLSQYGTNGKVGIGSNTPVNKLDVAGNIGMDQYLYHNGDTDTYLQFLTDRVLLFAGNDEVLDYEEGANSLLQIANGGEADVTIHDTAFFLGGSQGSYDKKVGIGTTQPTADRLHVRSGKL